MLSRCNIISNGTKTITHTSTSVESKKLYYEIYNQPSLIIIYSRLSQEEQYTCELDIPTHYSYIDDEVCPTYEEVFRHYLGPTWKLLLHEKQKETLEVPPFQLY